MSKKKKLNKAPETAVKKNKKRHGVRRFIATFFIAFFAFAAVGTVYMILTQEQFLLNLPGYFAQASDKPGKNQKITYGLLPETQPVSENYFDDAVFIGDSLTDGMSLMDFWQGYTYGVVGISLERALNEQAYPLQLKRGAYSNVITAASERRPGKIYMLFGTNGLGWQPNETLMEQYEELIDRLRGKNPNAVLYIQSIPPTTRGYAATNSRFHPEKVQAYNSELQKLAERKQCYFLDTYSVLRTEKGYLPSGFAAGDGLHLDREGYEVMYDYIVKHTAPRK